MKVKIKDILKVLDEEVKWHLKYPTVLTTKDYQLGFRAGLKQAILLIDEFKGEE